MLRYMLPRDLCARCAGTGHFAEEDAPTDRICWCLAGAVRGEYDDGGDIEEITRRLTGRTRDEWFADWRLRSPAPAEPSST